jgi:hypothetical protein
VAVELAKDNGQLTSCIICRPSSTVPRVAVVVLTSIQHNLSQSEFKNDNPAHSIRSHCHHGRMRGLQADLK